MSRLKFYLFLFGRCGIGRDRRGLVRLRTVCGLLLFGRLYDRDVAVLVGRRAVRACHAAGQTGLAGLVCAEGAVEGLSVRGDLRHGFRDGRVVYDPFHALDLVGIALVGHDRALGRLVEIKLTAGKNLAQDDNAVLRDVDLRRHGGRFGVRGERDAGAVENRVFVLLHQIKHRGIGIFAPLDGQLDRASNYGVRSVDLAAPGNYILSTITGNDYAYMSGTSMAAPMVTGTAAMLYSCDASLSLMDVRNRILQSARPLESLSGKVVTGGMLDAGAAMP